MNPAALIDDGTVQCKDGSLLVGWFYRGPTAPTPDEERVDLGSCQPCIIEARRRVGDGGKRLNQPPAILRKASAFPDPSRMVDDGGSVQPCRGALRHE